GCHELPHDAGVSIGKTETHVCIGIGPWTFLLPIDKEGRYPKAELVIPATSSRNTTWSLTQPDAEFLIRTLPKLPGADDDDNPVTLDLDGKAAVRARREGDERCTEIVLDGSQVLGPARRLTVKRQNLARAIQLGFREVEIVNDNAPAVCREPQR